MKLLNEQKELAVKYDVPFNNDLLEEVTRKEILWHLTDHGLFRSCFSRDQEVKFRFCGIFVETGHHLAFNCLAIGLNLCLDGFNTKKFEDLVFRMTIELYKN